MTLFGEGPQCQLIHSCFCEVGARILISLMFVFGLDMSTATRCRREGSYRLCINFSWFIITGLSIFSKFSRDTSAVSSAWYTHVNTLIA